MNDIHNIIYTLLPTIRSRINYENFLQIKSNNRFCILNYNCDKKYYYENTVIPNQHRSVNYHFI